MYVVHCTTHFREEWKHLVDQREEGEKEDGNGADSDSSTESIKEDEIIQVRRGLITTTRSFATSVSLYRMSWKITRGTRKSVPGG